MNGQILDLTAEVVQLTCLKKTNEADIQQLRATLCNLNHCTEDMSQKIVVVEKLNKTKQKERNKFLATLHDHQESNNSLSRHKENTNHAKALFASQMQKSKTENENTLQEGLWSVGK